MASSAVLNMETSTMILASKHEIPWTDEEPQTNAKNAYVCATHSPGDWGLVAQRSRKEIVAPTLRSARADLKVSATFAGACGPNAVRPYITCKMFAEKHAGLAQTPCWWESAFPPH